MKIGTIQSPTFGLVSFATMFRDHLCCVEFGPPNLVRDRLPIPIDEGMPPSPTVTNNLLACLETCAPYEGLLYVVGTDFQKEVWKALREIPCGQIVSYKAVADEIGRPSATRAVARAVAANPIAVVIPCHRVVGQKNPDAYHWGANIKRKLLDMEYLATHPTEIVLS